MGATFANISTFAIDTGALDTTIHAAYVADASYDPNAPDPYAAGQVTGDKVLPAGTTSASLRISGLDPETAYHFTVVATNADGTANSGDNTFTTGPLPTLNGSSSRDIEATTATLRVSLTPGADGTTYYFEYGTTTSYGSTAPSPPPGASAGPASQSPRAFAARLTGLSPSTTYHWRAVVVNGSATIQGPDRTFTTYAPEPGADVLPDGRVYELVSPFDTEGNDLLGAWGWPDGDHALGLSVGSFAGQTNGVIGEYLQTRTPNGWTTKPVADPGDPNNGYQLIGAAENLSHIFVQPLGGLLGGTAASKIQDVRSDGSRVDLVTLPTTDTAYAANSQDGSSVFVTQTAGVTPLLPEGAHTAGRVLYRIKNGTTEVAARDANGDVPDCGVALAGVNFSATSFMQTGISPDGNTFVVQIPDPQAFCPTTSDLYVRRSNGTSVDISAPSDPAVDDQAATFLGADQGVTKVFFMTGAQLEDSDTNGTLDIYEYDVASGQRTRVTASSDPNDDDANLLPFGPPAIVSPDGTRVYFVAGNAFNGQGTDGASNLWLWHNGALHFIRALTDSISLGNSAGITPDGRFLLFASPESLTGFDSTSEDGQRVPEIFRYSEPADAISCVSCDPQGGTPASGFPSPQLGVSSNFGLPNARAMSDDGQYVAFNTRDRLDSRDRNNKLDVYRWHNGNLSLISKGTGTVDSTAQNISASGRDIFFTAADRLVPGVDQDNLKLYDARIGGGLPTPSIPGPAQHCSGDDCQGKAAPAPAAPSPASATFQGSGNSKDVDSGPDQTRLTVAKLSKAAIARWAKTGKLSLRVTVGARGKVTAKATSRLPGHKKASTIASASRTAKKAGTVTLSLKLSKSSRAALKKRSLKVKLVVNSAGAAGPKTTNLTLKRQRGSARGAAAASAARNYGPTRG